MTKPTQSFKSKLDQRMDYLFRSEPTAEYARGIIDFALTCGILTTPEWESYNKEIEKVLRD